MNMSTLDTIHFRVIACGVLYTTGQSRSNSLGLKEASGTSSGVPDQSFNILPIASFVEYTVFSYLDFITIHA
jgi:hypothetical protein